MDVRDPSRDPRQPILGNYKIRSTPISGEFIAWLGDSWYRCRQPSGIVQLMRGNWKHGKYKTPEYNAWRSMRQRCRVLSPRFGNYSGRGISVCPRWQSFDNFLADMGPRPSPRHSLDRIDNSGNYEPNNCRWATLGQQNNNHRRNRVVVIDGEAKTLTEWRRLLGVKHQTVYWRMARGQSLEEALTTPVRRLGRRK